VRKASEKFLVVAELEAAMNVSFKEEELRAREEFLKEHL
jgi:hypothetical protein